MSFASAREAAKNKPKKKPSPKPFPRPKAPTKGKQGRGRPTLYSLELAEQICTRIALREPLSKICADPEMPCERQVYQWKVKYPEFAQSIARAREHRAEARADHMDDIAAELRAGTIDAHTARVLLENERWQAGKENKRYSDVVRTEVTGADGKDLFPTDGTATLDWLKKQLADAATPAVPLVAHEAKDEVPAEPPMIEASEPQPAPEPEHPALRVVGGYEPGERVLRFNPQTGKLE